MCIPGFFFHKMLHILPTKVTNEQREQQPRSQGPFSTSRKYPGCGWSRVYACQPKPHRGWVLNLILSTFSREVNVGLLMHQSIPAVPTPPPRATTGHLLKCQSRGWGISNFIAARGLGISLPRKDWLVRQGLEKLVDVFKGMFSQF